MLRTGNRRRIVQTPLTKSTTRRLWTILDALPFLVAYVDADERLLFLNRSYEADNWFGVPRANLIGRTMREVVGEQEYEAIRPFVETVLSGEPVHYEIGSVHLHSTVPYREATYIPDFDPATGKVQGYVAYVQDVTTRRRAEERILWMAHHDDLTGLPNRSLFLNRLQKAILEAAAFETRFAVLFIDLDGFKKVNDTYGHEAGDILLQRLAERLQKSLRDTDTAARLGGDEFAILLTDVDTREEASYVSRRLGASIGQPGLLNGHEYQVKASIGLSLFPDDGEDADSLIAHADHAMYQDKRATAVAGG